MNNEISLSKLLETTLIAFLLFFKRNRRVLFSSFFLGIAFAVSFFLLTQNRVKSRISAQTKVIIPQDIYDEDIEGHIGHSSVFDGIDAVRAANSLNILVSKKKLSATLGISQKDAPKIKEFICDTIENSDYYYIDVLYKYPIDLQKLEEGVIKYINSIPNIKAKIEEAKQANIQFITELNKQIGKLEELQLSFFDASKSQTTSNLIINDPTTLYYHNEILKLNILKQRSEDNIKNSTAINVFQSFDQNIASRFSIFYIIFFSMFFFIFFGILISLISDTQKKIKNNEQHNL